MDVMEEWAERFEEHRSHLRGVAYRMLGTFSEADDAVQEAWLRLARQADPASIDDLRGWLTTTTARICLDMLTSARARRETYVGPWLPEPAVQRAMPTDPADRVTLDESVSMALLVVLESLSPAERTAFVLHDVFAVPFDEVAATVGRSPAAVRQLASRARQHVEERRPRFTTAADEHERVLQAFFAAAAAGDLEGLVHVLDPDVVWRADGGGLVPAARRPIHGAADVARFTLGLTGHAGPEVTYEPAVVNGALGLIVRRNGKPLSVMAFTVADGRITEVDAVLNPEKLRSVPAR
jgi:RNA polymerase sigma-70 factor, ECF subfamily